jgi:hypothetical protein
MYSSDARSATPVDLTDLSDAGSQADGKSSRINQVEQCSSLLSLAVLGPDCVSLLLSVYFCPRFLSAFLLIYNFRFYAFSGFS